MIRELAAVAAAAAVLALSAGCGDEDHDADAQSLGTAADLATCYADATAAATPYPAGFPPAYPFPQRSVVFHAEDRGGDGTVVTAISKLPFKDVLAFLNGPVATAGFTVTGGETEEHDAEAEWSGNGFHGRWAIRESATCPGETTIQVLSAKD
ncbi:hypothetical protein [Nocardioides ultimimeridianus]